MNLQDLFASLPGLREKVPNDLNITTISVDTRHVVAGTLFIAVKGQKADGHDFLKEASQKGAVAFVVSDIAKVPKDLPGVVLQVPNTRPFVDLLAGKFYGEPSHALFCAGVTGTNGKTSTTYLIESLLNEAGIPCGVIGTVNHHLKNQVWPSEMTTPDALFLQSRLQEFREAGAKAVALEVSSHALDQKRADSVAFDVAVFTNLTRDHLDYHKSMDEYFAAKEKLFLDLLWRSPKAARAIVNTDDPWGRRIRIADPAKLWTYGTKDADFQFRILSQNFQRMTFHLKTPMGEKDFELPMSGQHNVQNAVAAIATAMAAGVSLEVCAQSLPKFIGVPGRLQSVPNQAGLSVFVDYAHTPDALENVLKGLIDVRSRTRSKARIWTVFGCGGDRDKGKRPLMAAMAQKYSDGVIVTSDNPRTEDPDAILREISAGFTGPREKIRTIADRRLAIGEAVHQATSGDVILIAGKGHEDYQIIGTDKKHFSDVEVATQFLKEKN